MTTDDTNWPAFLAESHAALRNAAAGVPDGAWDRPTPCVAWTVAQVAQHAAGDQLAYVQKLTDADGPDFDPFSPSGELPPDLVTRALDLSSAAWRNVAPDAEEVAVPLPPFVVPAWLGAGACALDAAVHAWDIAVATGQPSPLNPPLAAFLMKAADLLVEPVRAYGFYGPALVAPSDAGEVTALLAYLGRRAGWAPPA